MLGGRGQSGHTPEAKPLSTYANNDYWHDDVSDGPVTASVKLNGADVPVKGIAWVIVAPPKFAPAHLNLVTLYEVMGEAAGLKPPERAGAGKSERSIRMTLSLAFLDPKLARSAVRGSLPRGFGLNRLAELAMLRPEQWQALLGLGYTVGQGFHLAMPAPAEQIEALLSGVGAIAAVPSLVGGQAAPQR